MEEETLQFNRSDVDSTIALLNIRENSTIGFNAIPYHRKATDTPPRNGSMLRDQIHYGGSSGICSVRNLNRRHPGVLLEKETIPRGV